jgi:cytochrome c oxidase subunit 1
MFIGFNLTFQPMMVLGLLGMPRRISSYPDGLGWGFWNMMATAGAFLIAFSVLVFMVNVIISLRSGKRAGADPWDGRTLEWTIPSPPPAYNFAEIPTVRALDDFWHQKYVEDQRGVPVPAMAGGANGHATDEASHGGHGIHLPSPSFMPLIAAVGPVIIALGFIYDYALVAVGAAVTLYGVFGWALEPETE